MEEIITKKVSGLSEHYTPADTDTFLFGSGGYDSIKKISWRNLVAKLRELLFINNLTTTLSGYGLDARQGKVLQDEIYKLQTNSINAKIVELQTSVYANTNKDLSVSWGIPPGATLSGYYVAKVAGEKITTDITFCNFILSSTLRIRSSIDQTVKITVGCLYTV